MSNETETHAEYAQAWSGRGNLEQLVAELNRQKESRLDFVADTRHLHIDDRADGRLVLGPEAGPATEWLDSGGLPLSDSAYGQVCSGTHPPIPIKFGRHLAADQPDLAANLVCDLWARNPKRRFIRCLDGQVRAMLSDQYRVLDNYDLAFAALDAAREHGGEVVECSLSDKHMRLKLVNRSLWDAINQRRTGGGSDWYAGGMGSAEHLRRVGARTEGDMPGGPDTVHPSITISNSETGHGGTHVRIGILRAICFNLATVEDVASRVHLGGRLDAGIYTMEAQEADSRATFLKIRDNIHAAFTVERFEAIVAKAQQAQSDAIAEPTAAVDLVAKKHDLTEADRDAILTHFVRDYDPTRYGLAQAVARYSQDVSDADAASDMEDLAGALVASAI